MPSKKVKQKVWGDWCSRSALIDRSIIDEKTRSIRTVIATEDPVVVYDWERWQPIREILLINGVRYPDNNQVVLLDNHSRWEGVKAVKGSTRDIEVNNNELIGRTYFAATDDVENDWIKTRDGHITDVSAGYRTIPDKSVIIKPGETAVVEGKRYKNDYGDGLDLVIRIESYLKEVSLTPIGADERAKFRSEISEPENKEKLIEDNNFNKKGERTMPKPNEKKDGEDIKRSDNDDSQVAAHKKEMNEARGEGKREGQRAENDRQKEVRAVVDLAILSDEKRTELIAKFIGDPEITVDKAREEVLKAQKDAKDNPVEPEIRVEVDEKDKFQRGCVDTIVHRAGLLRDEKVIQDVEQNSMPASWHGLIRECLFRENIKRAVHRLSGEDLYEEGCRLFRAYPVSSGDFASILMDAANKLVGQSFLEEEVTYPIWTDFQSVKDFKTIYLISKSHISDWDKLLDGEPFSFGKMADKHETGAADTYGKAFGFPRKAIVNDDMGMFNDAMTLLGSGAARKLNDTCYDDLTSNSLAGPSMTEDSNNLFDSSNHANVKSTSGTVSHTSLKNAEKLLKDVAKLAPDKTSQSRRVGKRGKFLVTGTDNEIDIIRFLSAAIDIDASISTVPNVWKGRVKPAFDPYLQDKLDDNSKSNAWYLMSGPLFRILYLNGRKQPTVRRAESTVTQALGVLFDAYFDFGVAAKDWRLAVYNDGASA